MMARIIYVLCALTASVCAYLLWRGYRHGRARLLLWGSICFVGLALNNIVLVIDRLVLPDVDLTLLRMAPAVVGIAALIYGLVVETD
jgi:hypothetical protein